MKQRVKCTVNQETHENKVHLNGERATEGEKKREQDKIKWCEVSNESIWKEILTDCTRGDVKNRKEVARAMFCEMKMM